MDRILMMLAAVYMARRLCAGAMALPEAIMTNDFGKFVKAVIGF